MHPPSTTTLIYKTGHVGFAKPSFKLKNVTELASKEFALLPTNPIKKVHKKSVELEPTDSLKIKLLFLSEDRNAVVGHSKVGTSHLRGLKDNHFKFSTTNYTSHLLLPKAL